MRGSGSRTLRRVVVYGSSEAAPWQAANVTTLCHRPKKSIERSTGLGDSATSMRRPECPFL